LTNAGRWFTPIARSQRATFALRPLGAIAVAWAALACSSAAAGASPSPDEDSCDSHVCQPQAQASAEPDLTERQLDETLDDLEREIEEP
jgi:hypothetical protein